MDRPHAVGSTASTLQAKALETETGASRERVVAGDLGRGKPVGAVVGLTVTVVIVMVPPMEPGLPEPGVGWAKVVIVSLPLGDRPCETSVRCGP